MTAIPFAAKALVGTVPELALVSSKPVTLQELVEDFCLQLDNAPALIANVMQSGSATMVIHCTSERNANVVLNSGLCFRGHPLTLKPAPSTTWVKLTRVVYGTTENAIKSRLTEYGTVQKIRREVVNGIGISVYSVKMDLKKPIPSRITIAHHPVNVFYRGQVQQCFRCDQTGHISKNCPRKKSADSQPPVIVGPTEMAVTSSPVVELPPPGTPNEHLSPSEESMETTLNDITGKRQHHPAKELQHPAKIQKLPDVTYIEYERERTRLYVLGDSASADDHELFEDLALRIPEESHDTFQETFVYRHPLLAAPPEEEFAHFVKHALETGNSVDGLFDLSDTELFCPKLPSDSSVPQMSYSEFDSLLKTECLNIHGYSITVPPDSKLLLVELHQAHKAVSKLFTDHFYMIYPELMVVADVRPAKQSEIKDRIIQRNT